MGRTLEQKLKTLRRSRRARVEKRAAELIEEELSLRDLRKALDRTQLEIARNMGVGQDTVSRYEQLAAMKLSTLERDVSAMGGTLTLLTEFPDRKPVRVRTLGELSEESSGMSAGVLTKRSSRR